MSSSESAENRYRNTIGSIVSWGIFRMALVIGVSLLFAEYVRWIDYSTWAIITLVMLYAAVVHPMQVQYRIYREETLAVMDGTLCSTCKYFEPTGVLCSKLDEHVSEDHIPCEGELWEPE
ncbi:MAG: hypothetical protein KFH87_02370 [Bacteroidetes bacterium]|nr:hypothetical protein [Bacteroidota bacterium]